jgi:tRNA dimethylallyltransferase
MDVHAYGLPPLVAVVGATGTGKSDVAVAIAERYGGEVIGADAYQVYRGMDIGTAKLDAETRRRIPHHFIDVVDPDDTMTLARYLDLSHAALADIWGRNLLPVVAGGSGQYVWALIEGWRVPRVVPDSTLRGELEDLARREGTPALVAWLASLDNEAAARLDPENPRRLIRAIEVVSTTGLPLSACQTREALDADVLILGLRLEREELYHRLDRRTDAMYEAGFIEEVRRLRDGGYGEAPAVRGGVGYKEAGLYLDGALDLDEAVRRHKNANHRLVRRQAAWFKAADPRIRWIDVGPDTSQECIRAVDEWLEKRSET